MSSVFFSSQDSILMMFLLNSESGILLISVSSRSLTVTFFCSFFLDEFLHFGILCRSLSSSLLGKTLMFLFLRVMALLRRSHIYSRAWHFRNCSWCMLCVLCCCFLAILFPRSVLCRISPCLKLGVFGSCPLCGEFYLGVLRPIC